MLLALTIFTPMVLAQTVDFRLGAMSMEDFRYIFPTTGQLSIPDGQSLEQHNNAITIEPRLHFIRVHDELCFAPTKGHFKNYDELFWFCAKTESNLPGTIVVANPKYPGHRKPVDFKALPSKDDFLFIVPLATRKDAVIIAKTATPGNYDIYTKTGKLDKPLITGDPLFNDVTKLRAIIAPEKAKKPNDLYFYMENVVGAHTIFQYKIDDKSTNKINLKTLDEPMNELKRIMHATVSETFISFTGAFGVQTDQLRFIFFKHDETAASQIQKKPGQLSYREVPQENGKTETAATALAWAFKSDDDYADVLILNKTPKDINTKPYVQFGRAVKVSVNTDTVNDFLKTHTFDREHDEHKNY